MAFHAYLLPQTPVDASDICTWWIKVILITGKTKISPTEGLHVTAYQANFASHHTRDRHVGFLLAYHSNEKQNKMSITLYLVYTKVPNYIRVIKILALTLGGNFKSLYEVNQKFKHFCCCCFSLYCAIQKGNQVAGQNRVRIGAYYILHTPYWSPRPGKKWCWRNLSSKSVVLSLFATIRINLNHCSYCMLQWEKSILATEYLQESLWKIDSVILSVFEALSSVEYFKKSSWSLIKNHRF